MNDFGWWYIGRFSGGTSGETCELEFIGGGGYNGLASQHATAKLLLRNSNGLSPNISASYYETGLNNFLSGIVLSSQSTGNVGGEANWDIYFNLGAYVGSPIVRVLSGLNSAFSLTVSSQGSVSATNGTTVLAATEFFASNSPYYLLNNVAIGNTTPSSTLDVTGTLRVSSSSTIPTLISTSITSGVVNSTNITAVNLVATTSTIPNLNTTNITTASLFSNAGITSSSIFVNTGITANNLYLNTNTGVQLNGADRPFITRGYDTFTSGIYNGVGRWGMFMEASALTMGIPTIGAKFQFVSYNADSTINTTFITINNSATNTVDINGTLRTSSSATIPTLVSTSITSGSINAANSTVVNVVSTNISSSTLNATGITVTNILSTNISGSNLNINGSRIFLSGTGISNSVEISINKNGTNPNLRLGVPDAVDVMIVGATTGSAIVSNDFGPLQFGTGAVGTATSRMIINTSGNIGIGNIAPITTLDITGTLRVSSSGSIPTLIATSISSGSVNCSNSTITNFVSTNITSTNLRVSSVFSTSIISSVIASTTYTGGSMSLSGNVGNGGFDFVLGNTDQSSRGDSGNSRAFVKEFSTGAGSRLFINYSNDFPGGTTVNSVFTVTAASRGSVTGANGRFDGAGVVGDSGTKGIVAEFGGYVMATGFYSTSDIRLKENIKDIDTTLIKHIDPVSYNFIGSQKKSIGLIAQQVSKYYPELINETPGYIPNIMKQFTSINRNSLYSLYSKENIADIGDILGCYIDKSTELSKCIVINKKDNVYTLDKPFNYIYIKGSFDTNIKSIDYSGFIPLLLKEYQKQEKLIHELTEKLDLLYTFYS